MTSAGRTEWLSGTRLALVDRATELPAVAVDLSVCHVSSGVVQALLATAGILGEPSLVARAMEYHERVLRAVRRNGFHTPEVREGPRSSATCSAGPESATPTCCCTPARPGFRPRCDGPPSD